MFEYYFLNLSSIEKNCYRKIVKSIEAGSSSVSIMLMNAGAISKIITAVSYDHPEFFYVNFRNLNFMSTPVSTTYMIDYNVKVGIRQQVIDKIENIVNKVVEVAMNSNLSGDLSKCRWIHNYLVKNVRYNHAAASNSSVHLEAFGVRSVFQD